MSLCTFIYNIIIKTIINTYFPPLLMIVGFIFNLLLLIPALAPPQTSFGVSSSRIHVWMRDEQTPKDVVCGEGTRH